MRMALLWEHDKLKKKIRENILKARRILSGLGFTNEMQYTATKNLSTACRMRVLIARALYLKPNLERRTYQLL